MHKRSWLSKTVWNWYLVVKEYKKPMKLLLHYLIFFFWVIISILYTRYFIFVPHLIVHGFAEAYWDNCSFGWSLVQHKFSTVTGCMLFFELFGCSSSLSWFFYSCSMFPKSTHKTFSNKLFQNFRAHPRLEKAKFSETDFIMSHYAGKACNQLQAYYQANDVLIERAFIIILNISNSFAGHVSDR